MLVSRKSGQNGLNVVALDPFKHEVIMNSNFDTSSDKNASHRFVKHFKRLPTGAVIVIGVKGDGLSKISG
jgi:hypothetical protein